MKDNRILYWRKAVARTIDKIYYRAGNAARSHSCAHERFGKYLCAVGYETYMDYLKTEIPAEYELPPYVVAGLEFMVLAAEKYPLPVEEDEIRELVSAAEPEYI